MPLSIAHVSFSRAGGAGSVAAALAIAQNEAGHNAQHIWSIQSDLRSQPFARPLHTLAAGMDHYLVRNSDFNAPISVLRDFLNTALQKTLGEVDIIHIHNVNGLVDVRDLSAKFSEKKIVWTLHDMNPFTAACHYSLGCEKFSDGCSGCPAVRSIFQPFVRDRFMFKKTSLSQVSNLQIVSPSEWLAHEASKSTLMSRFPITVIPNPFSTPFARDPNPTTQFSFCVVAKNLDDPVKNVGEVVTQFSRAQARRQGLTLALVGAGGESFVAPGITRLGTLSHKEIAALLSKTQALIVNSHAENAPLVIAEAAAVGCLPLVRKVGGMPAIIGQLGWGHTFSSGPELGVLLEELSSSNEVSHAYSRKELADRAKSLYSASAIADQYDEVYER